MTAPIKIKNRHQFATDPCEGSYTWAISISEYDEDPPRPGFCERNGQRIDFNFWDNTDGPGIATPEDIEKLYHFSKRWAKAANADATRNGLLVHCFAGISRSTSSSLMPLILFYRDVKKAAQRLFEVRPCAHPNSHIMNLIDDRLHLRGDLFRAVFDAQVRWE